MIHHHYFKVGQHRDYSRLWFEGRRLADTGARPGMYFDVVLDATEQQIRIEISETGKRVISGRGPAHPLIEINDQILTDFLGQAERVRAVFSPGRVTITISPVEAAIIERRARLLNRIACGASLRIGSVFSGASVLDHAIHSGLAAVGVGAELAFAIEKEQRYQDTALLNNPVYQSTDAMLVVGSADEIVPSELPVCELLLSGIPCTGASLSGRARLGLEHAESHPEAGHLFIPLLEIVRACRPSILVLENVVPYRNTASYAAIKGHLGALGYDLHETVLKGNEMGALEGRDRLCAVAVTRGIPFSWAGLHPVRTKEQTLGEVLDPTAGGWSRMEGLRAKEKRDKAKYKDQGWGTGFKMQIVTASSTTVPTIGRDYSKVRSSEPKVAAHPTDPDLLRQLTPGEHAAVKAIPFQLVEGEVPSVQHQMLGQGVIHPAFLSVGVHIGKTLRRRASIAAASGLAASHRIGEIGHAPVTAAGKAPVRQMALF
jgi:DNA (cytosine-5)-methyltransferase 1